MKSKPSMLTILAEVIFAWLLADLLSGVGHWVQDAYFTEDSPWPFTEIGRSNALHHRYPRDMIRWPWWQTVNTTVPLSLAGTCLLMWVMGTVWSLFAWCVCVFATASNQIHKWAHMRPRELPWWVRLAQDWGILLGREHHSRHHRKLFDSHYCAVNGHCNWLLDRGGVWRGIEHGVYLLTGIRAKQT